MIDREKVMLAVSSAIDELNQQLPKEEKLDKNPAAPLSGSDGNLDSLQLVSLVTTLEQKIEDNFGITVTLLDDIASLENDNPFSTVGSLASFVTAILENK